VAWIVGNKCSNLSPQVLFDIDLDRLFEVLKESALAKDFETTDERLG
jgi:hypothetical protein